MIKKELISNWEACFGGGSFRVRNCERWSPPPRGILKFNVYGAARGKPGTAGIGSVLRNHDGHILLSFSSFV